jgi:prepilin-type processing-associated H-X9-DG protein
VQVSVDESLDDSCVNPNDRVREFASLHPGGANFLFADGSVHFVRDNIQFRVYQALSTIQGGEVAAWTD